MIGRLFDAGVQAIAWQSPVLLAQAASAAVVAAAPSVPGIEMLAEVQDELAILVFSGVAGAFAKAVMFPQKGWRNRAIYGFSSAISAVFLGGLLGAIAANFGAQDVYAFLASGFLTGFAGREGITAIQIKLLGKQS